ncbi:hypothetical protein BDP55DRAFT_640531 [Colletotrichum godetiae]|uniref:Secreted protein n=1 Tax=Colletotrichum godetiae TaxID=1209918 RepID=A0AAJ0AZE6_9PEZI|nr:uncharacterized protein BDP55DRAFT_640531 [Colletotrichum godetiae]KAK1701108.1 hypothetical protein BDP55DRAFT_640531 [Colletotrichum godetiae]
MRSLYRVVVRAVVPWLWCFFSFLSSGACRVSASQSIPTTRAVHSASPVRRDTSLFSRDRCDLRTSEGTSPAGLRSSRDGDT